MMKINRSQRTVSIYLLIIAVVFQGLSGLFGGLGLIMDPNGETLQIPLNWLEGSPFNDYFFPGLILLAVLGLFPIIVSIGLWKEMKWSWPGAIAVGLALIVWIAVEIVIIGYHSEPPLQAIYGTLGIVILIFALLPSVRRFYRI